MINYFTTKEDSWLKQWDVFVMTHLKGNHLQYSHWIQSYLSYGFDYEIGLAVQDDKIIGGYAAVIAQKIGFKFYCISNGPLFEEAIPNLAEDLIVMAKKSAQEKKCCCLQVSVSAASQSSHQHIYPATVLDPIFKEGAFGKPFPFVFSANGLNWVDFEGVTIKEEFLQSHIKTNVRRDIRSALRKEICVKAVTGSDEIEKAYRVFENNAKQHGYSIRAWSDFKETLMGLISTGTGVLLGAYHEQVLKGAVFLVKAGGYFTYIMGGTLKEKPDLLMGELLQWKALELSFDEHCNGYNISLGGSKGVVNFKNKFSPEVYSYQNNSYYWVLKPIPFKIYQKLYFYLKKYKPIIAKLISK